MITSDILRRIKSMKKLLYLLVCLSVVLSACGLVPTASPPAPTTPSPTVTPTSTDTPTPTITDTPTFTPTPLYPVEGLGPSNFPANVDQLTGLKVTDPSLLQRRPMVIKVQNLPRTG